MNLYEIIYAIREGLKEYTDDTKYTDDYLMYLVRLKRASYIRREYSVLNRIVDQDISQTFCMALELVSDTECPECEFDIDDCEVVRTAQKLPYPIELHNKSMIMRVAPIGVLKSKFDFVSRERAIFAGEGEFEKNAVFAFLHSNGHIYLKSKKSFYKSLDAITVTAVLENPEEVTLFKGCGGPNTPCYTLDKDRYPVKNWMIDLIIKEIINELARMKSLPEDNLNNSNDDNG